MPKKGVAQVKFWSRSGKSLTDANLRKPGKRVGSQGLCFEFGSRFHAGKLRVPAPGALILDIASPRPVRMWLNGTLVLDEGLDTRLFQRELRSTVVFPCAAPDIQFLVEVGQHYTYSHQLDEHCPSRNRKRVMREIARIRPDRLTLRTRIEAGGTNAPALSLRFPPTQFHKDGVVWQHVLVRPTTGIFAKPPTSEFWPPVERPLDPLFLTSSAQPGNSIEGTTDNDRRYGYRRFFVPVANEHDSPAPLRAFGPDARPEPIIEIARTLELTVDGDAAPVIVDMPAYESLGRFAPQREFKAIAWPRFEDIRPQLPDPILPDRMSGFAKLYDATWQMLLGLVRHPSPEGGMPNSYVSTGAGFKNHQFVWDTSFSAISTGYGWRVFPYRASLDVLYSRQFDGGYIHRENDVRDGMPAAYEPDFSPNPPIMSVAEWSIYTLTGDALRLRKVYPVLVGNHKWLQHNRRLPDGTYWTTGLANGLDNSPSLGDGYPDLSAQMAHEAEILSKIALLLGYGRESAMWRKEHKAIGKAINTRLWSEKMQIYSTSLPGGGHNPNKVVTAFWPLWAGVVPQPRIAALARHLKDPKSFWRHHPIPSLAADSPQFRPAGDYWLGSAWAPTNYASIKGFDRAGRHDLAYETTLRHLECMTEVFNKTGYIWENYCSESSDRGSWSGQNYCWSSLGPIALLFEVIIGIEADAAGGRIRWNPPDEDRIGARNFPLGQATVSLNCWKEGAQRWVEVCTDKAFVLEMIRDGRLRRRTCTPGTARFKFHEV